VAPRSHRSPAITVGEILLWLLFFALLVPAGIVGWAIGHSTAGGTHTVTVRVSAPATTVATHPTTTTAPATSTKPSTPTPTTTVAGAAAAQGKVLFVSNGCGSCHTFNPAGASGTIGPNLDTAPATDAVKAHAALAAFIRDSIVKPNLYIAPGYPRGVMPETFATSLTKAQVDALVAYIVSGKT
jgi:mono/diheme cytochrome c family protein